jgi:hypothetical protein
MKDLLTMLLPVIVAALTNLIYEYFQKAVALLQKLPAPVTRILVGVLSYGLTVATVKLGVVLSVADPTMLSQADMAALASAGLSYVFHLGDQTKKLQPPANG